MRYIQPWVKGIWEWVNGTAEGNGMWKSEGVARRLKTANKKKENFSGILLNQSYEN